MKFSTVLLALIVTSAFATEPLGVGEPAQSKASFEAAIHDDSTAPRYVLITVIDARAELARSICTTSNLLMGAIHREHDLGYDEASRSRAKKIALSSKAHVFRFTKQDALQNIPVTYSESDLARVRAILAPLSIDELRAGFASYEGKLHSLENTAHRDAVACVLIERGLSPAMGDRVPGLWLAP